MVTDIPAQRSFLRRTLMLGVLAILLAAVVGLAIAWSQGTFESRLTYWRARGQNCGSVIYGPNVAGTDTGETDTFVVEPRDYDRGCDLGLHTSFGIVVGRSTTAHDVQCARVMATEGPLTISGCQDVSDITMP